MLILNALTCLPCHEPLLPGVRAVLRIRMCRHSELAYPMQAVSAEGSAKASAPVPIEQRGIRRGDMPGEACPGVRR